MALAQGQPGTFAPRLARIPNAPVLTAALRPRDGAEAPELADPMPGSGPQPSPESLAPSAILQLLPQGPEFAADADPETAVVLGDQLLSGYSWYVPQFELVSPAPGAAAAGSPFSYSFSVSGHDDQGHPVLDATITAQIQAALADDVRQQIPATDQVAEISLDTLQPSLLVPFRDSVTGTLTSTAVPAAEISRDGDTYSLVFAIHGNLARAAYGSLSMPGYQANPAQLIVQFSFTAQRLVQVPWVGRWPGHPPVMTLARDDPATALTQPVTAEIARPGASVMLSAAAERISEPIASPLTGLITEQPPRFGVIPMPVSRWEPVSISRTNSLDVLVPCTAFGQLYIDASDAANPKPIGCQDAIALGELPGRLYTPVDSLGSDDYQVLASVSRPAVYLLVPHRYRVGRAAPGHQGVTDWAPLIRWIQEFDATQGIALPCRLQANLQPDVGPSAVASVLAALAELSPNPTLLLPTSFGSGMSELTVTSWNSPANIQTSLDGDTIQVSADMDYASAVIMNGMLTTGASEGALVGNASFSLTDGTTLGPIELHVDVVRLAGPWPDGPVLVAAADAASVTVTNNAENGATVSQILSSHPDGHSEVLADGLALEVAPGGKAAGVPISAAVPPGGRLVAACALADSGIAVIDQQRIYIEDLHTTITVINDANMKAAGINSVDVTARLDSDTQAFTFTMTQDLPIFQLDLVQPIVADRPAQAGLLHVTALIHKDGQPDTSTGDFIADLHKGVLIQLSAVLDTAA